MDYIKEREERAVKFAKSMRTTPYAVMLEWWEGDKHDPRWSKATAGRSGKQGEDSQKSYDTDDFFNASMSRSYTEFYKKYPELNPV